MQIAADRLTDFIAEIFTTCGAAGEVAREVAEHLVAANLKGHDSHGIGMTPAYVHNIRTESTPGRCPCQRAAG